MLTGDEFTVTLSALVMSDEGSGDTCSDDTCSDDTCSDDTCSDDTVSADTCSASPDSLRITVNNLLHHHPYRICGWRYILCKSNKQEVLSRPPGMYL